MSGSGAQVSVVALRNMSACIMERMQIEDPMTVDFFGDISKKTPSRVEVSYRPVFFFIFQRIQLMLFIVGVGWWFGILGIPLSNNPFPFIRGS